LEPTTRFIEREKTEATEPNSAFCILHFPLFSPFAPAQNSCAENPNKGNSTTDGTDRKRLKDEVEGQRSDFPISRFQLSAFALASPLWSEDFTAKLFCNVECWLERLAKLIGLFEGAAIVSRNSGLQEKYTISHL
jgi:hypothetical protein